MLPLFPLCSIRMFPSTLFYLAVTNHSLHRQSQLSESQDLVYGKRKGLNNQPGVFSARFAGDEKNSEKNIQKLLSLLKNKKNRKAQFRTVVTLIYDNKFYFIEGKVNGLILHKKRGVNGFGYDPIFCPLGYNKSFGEISQNQKNLISQRSIAFSKLKKLIQNI